MTNSIMRNCFHKKIYLIYIWFISSQWAVFVFTIYNNGQSHVDAMIFHDVQVMLSVQYNILCPYFDINYCILLQLCHIANIHFLLYELELFYFLDSS